MPWNNQSGGGALGLGLARPVGLGTATTGRRRDRPTSRNFCAGARTGCAACFPAISAAAASP